MSRPILVVCVTCGVVFDLRRAKKCDGHETYDEAGHQRLFERERCFICPLGHAGHDSKRWREGARREPTTKEREAGIDWMLRDYAVEGA